jgi:hypothetical protein
MKKFFQILYALSIVAWLASPALASLAVNFTGTDDVNNQDNGSYSLGFQFITNAPITVTALGFYDYHKDGLAASHDVGIYNSSGTLLVSTTVLTADPLISFFRFHTIAPYTLPAGQHYYIMAVTDSEKYTFYTKGFTVNPSITFVQDAWYWDFAQVPQVPQQTLNLTFPNDGTGITQAMGGAYFGPNFLSHTPLPGSLLLVGSGLLGLIGFSRRRRR